MPRCGVVMVTSLCMASMYESGWAGLISLVVIDVRFTDADDDDSLFAYSSDSSN